MCKFSYSLKCIGLPQHPLSWCFQSHWHTRTEWQKIWAADRHVRSNKMALCLLASAVVSQTSVLLTGWPGPHFLKMCALCLWFCRLKWSPRIVLVWPTFCVCQAVMCPVERICVLEKLSSGISCSAVAASSMLMNQQYMLICGVFRNPCKKGYVLIGGQKSYNRRFKGP